MADARRSNDEKGDPRGLAFAEAELIFFYQHANGSSGLRSTFGSQLEAMHAGTHASPTIDMDSVERNMAKAIANGGGDRRAVVLETFRGLSHEVAERLRLAYKERPLRPGVSRVVALTSQARKAVAQEIGRTPTPLEIEAIIAHVDINSAWLKRSQVAAALMVEAALAEFAAEFLLVTDAVSRRGGREVRAGWWRWVDDGRRRVG